MNSRKEAYKVYQTAYCFFNDSSTLITLQLPEKRVDPPSLRQEDNQSIG